jgi:hypothetical protein
MNKERIQINGVWYVQEEQPLELDTTEFRGMVVEDEQYCFEATQLVKNKDEYYPGVDIKFTDKRTKPWKEEHWDNNNWIIGVYEGNELSLTEAYESMCSDGVKTLQAFIKVLIDKGWIEY